jgi:hypothetical protein
MDRHGAPDIVWLQAMEYMADVFNNTADESLGWITPIQKQKGHTPDISAFLHFTFYEKVYYMDSNATYPSSKEKTGYWIGVSKHLGDALTYEILAGKHAVIVRALYGLKTSGAAYRNHFASYLRSLGFMSCLADPDIWLRTAKGQEGDEFYEYLLVYTDNLLAIATNPKAILDDVNVYFNLKPESVGHPNIYLGSKVSKAKMANGVECWCNSSSQYVKEAVKNIEAYISKHKGKLLSGKTRSPMETDYRPELDVTPALGPTEANYYQSQIGVLRWVVELGRMDIGTAKSKTPSKQAPLVANSSL